MTTTAELKKLYGKGKKRKLLAIFSVSLAVIITALISISIGAASPGLVEAIQVIMSKIPFLHINPGSSLDQTIILNIRLPRIVLGIVAGAGLAAAGVTMQGVLRNPLVSSYVLGISSAAGFGAALAIVLGVSLISFGGYLIIGNAFLSQWS
jgi:iron complex transport system permease protein